jgi:WD40 repeat protein
VSVGAPPARIPLKDERVLGLDFSPDGRLLACGTSEGMVRIWDTDSCQEQVRFHADGGRRGWLQIVFSPDGQMLASFRTHCGDADSHDTIRLWDADNGRELACLRGHALTVAMVTFSSDGRRLASAGVDGSVRVWETESGREIVCLRGNEGKVQTLSYSPDGRRLASGDSNQTVRVWDTTSWSCVEVIQGCSDINRIAAGAAMYPLRAVRRDGEVVIESALNGDPVVWAETGDLVVGRSSPRAWVGGTRGQLVAYRLEGALPE